MRIKLVLVNSKDILLCIPFKIKTEIGFESRDYKSCKAPSLISEKHSNSKLFWEKIIQSQAQVNLF
ncbi:MAG TPA: hypothetical protein DCG18_07940 [Richelia sp.]|nr:hypothetical protein [Richelia sp.]